MSNIIKMRNKSDINALNEMCQYLKDKGVKTMALIGVYTGEDAVVYANYFDKVYCIDPWLQGYDNNDIAFDSDMKKVEEIFDEKCKKYPQLIKLKMDSQHAFYYFKDNNINIHFSYIDGNHIYEYTKKDILMYFMISELFIGGHDYTCKEHPGVKKAVDEIFNEKELTLYDDSSWLVNLREI